MAIFARRTLQRMLNEIAPILTEDQMKGLVHSKLNRPESIPLPYEWEVALLWCLGKLGDVEYEPVVGGGTPDIVFNDADPERAGFVADITTVSDAGLEKENPVEEFRERFWQQLRKRDMTARGLEYEIGRHTTKDSRKILKLPKGEMHRVFNRDFGQFLNQVKADPTSARRISILDEDVEVHVSYNPKRSGFGGSIPGYKEATRADRNPIYNSLQSKRARLRKLKHDGAVVIFLCDGDCATLRNQPLGTHSYGLEHIVLEFLRKTKSISAVSVLSTRTPWTMSAWDRTPIIEMRCFENPDATYPVSGEMKRTISRIPDLLPAPINEAMNAVFWYRGSRKEVGVPLGGSSHDPNTGTIRLAAREVAELLAGRITQKEFFKTHRWAKEHSPTLKKMPNPFEWYLSQGRMLIDMRVERCADEDDDWVIFRFGEPDPAISPFVVPGGEPDEDEDAGD